MRRSSVGAGACGLLLWLPACEPVVNQGSGGVDLPVQWGPDGASCGRGLAVLMTDYVSTNVGIVDLAGVTHSGSFVSSSSASTRLNAPLGGDVALPSTPLTDELVLLDRFPTSVLTFVSLETGQVRGQLDVGQGFAANPQDYLELSPKRALVSRYDKNPRPDAPVLERGDDVLVIDPSELRIVTSIDLGDVRTEGFLARPGHFLRVGARVLLTVSGHDARFGDASVGRVVTLDPESEQVSGVTVVEGMKNCGGLALSPSEKELAVSCSGLVDGADEQAPTDSGVVRFAVQTSAEGEIQLTELARYPASEWQSGPVSPSLAYADEGSLLVGCYGAVEGADAGRPDRVLLVRTDSGAVSTVLESQQRAFTLGQIQCVSPCAVCFVADASLGRVHRLGFDAGDVERVTTFPVDNGVGLPPRLLGRF